MFGVRISSSTKCSNWPPKAQADTPTAPDPTRSLKVATLPLRPSIAKKREISARGDHFISRDVECDDGFVRSTGLNCDFATRRNDHAFACHAPIPFLAHVIARREEDAVFERARGQEVLPRIIDRRCVGSDYQQIGRASCR